MCCASAAAVGVLPDCPHAIDLIDLIWTITSPALESAKRSNEDEIASGAVTATRRVVVLEAVATRIEEQAADQRCLQLTATHAGRLTADEQEAAFTPVLAAERRRDGCRVGGREG